MTEAKCYICENHSIVNLHCAKCNRAYCQECVSDINPAMYCDNCQRDVVITETSYRKTHTDFDIDTNTLSTRKSNCKQIIFKGIDWMFAAQKIAELPEEELKPVLYYHRAMVKHLEQELLSRSIFRSHEYAIDNKDGRRIIKTSTQTKTKTTKTSRVVPVIDMERALQMAANMTIEQLEEFIKKLKVTP